MLQTLRSCGKATPSTHLARTRRRRVAESKAGDHIHRQEAAMWAAGTRSSPLCSTRHRVMQIQLFIHAKQHTEM